MKQLIFIFCLILINNATTFAQECTLIEVCRCLQVLSGIREEQPEGWLGDIVVEQNAPLPTQWQSITTPIPEGERWKIVQVAAEYEVSSLLIRLLGNPTPAYNIYVWKHPKTFEMWMEPGQIWMLQRPYGPVSVDITFYIERYEVE